MMNLLRLRIRWHGKKVMYASLHVDKGDLSIQKEGVDGSSDEVLADTAPAPAPS